MAGANLAAALEADADSVNLLSYSQISDFSRCSYRWELSRVRGIRRRVDPRPLTTGSAVHQGLAAGILSEGNIHPVKAAVENYAARALSNLPDDPPPEAVEEIKSVGQESLDIAVRAVRDLDFDRYSTLIIPDTDVVLVEQQLVVPLDIGGWDGFRFYADWVMHDSDLGINWLVDHKVRANFYDDDAEEVNLQAALYQAALLFFEIEVHGTATYQIRRRTPAKPKTNKDGSISRARIATDWDTYRQAVLDAGRDPADYLDMKDKLDYEWQRWSRAHRGREELKQIWERELVQAAIDIDRPDRICRRALRTFECNNCWARDFCMAELRGHDTEFLLKTHYYNSFEEEGGRRRWDSIEMTDEEEEE